MPCSSGSGWWCATASTATASTATTPIPRWGIRLVWPKGSKHDEVVGRVGSCHMPCHRVDGASWDFLSVSSIDVCFVNSERLSSLGQHAHFLIVVYRYSL